jgi:predicted Zn finger-like uncharacterized protein
MFRVECTNCKAAYQVDERRVPAKGLTMKCPKCRESFLVSPPDKPAVPVEKAPLPAVDNFGGTMIGVSTKGILGGGGQAASEPSKPAPVGISVPRAPRGNDATMIGVAPSSKAATPSDAADLPDVRSSGLPKSFVKTGKTQELPVSSPPGPVSSQNTRETASELPALKSSSKTPAVGPFTAVAPKKASRINLSSLSPSHKPDAAPKANEGATGTTSGGVGAAELAGTEAELPALVDKWPSKVAKPVSTFADDALDLPAVIGSPVLTGSASGGSSTASPTSRLHKPTAPELPSARVAPKSAPEAVDLFEMDLPSVLSQRAAEVTTSPTSVSLPAALSLSAPLENQSPPFGEIAPASDKKRPRPPSALTAPLELDEPTRLPQSSAPASLGNVDEVIDLDSEGVSLESLAPSKPPTADLPEVAGLDLPDVLGESALPSLPKGLDDAGLGFGELDLPTIGQASGSASKDELETGLSHELPDFSLSEPPLANSSQPPSFRARRDSFGDFDGVPSFAPSVSSPNAASDSMSAAEEGLFEGESFSFGDERLPAVTSSRGETIGAVGGAGTTASSLGSAEEYGQVNLDAGAGNGVDTDDDGMEFGGIPQADSEPPKGIPVGSDAPRPEHAQPEVVRAAMPAGVEPVASTDAKAKPKRTGLKAGIAAAALLAVGGGALALVPEVGPFGVYFAQDLFLKGDRQTQLASLVQAVEGARATDSYPAAVAAVNALNASRETARRFLPLKAESAAQSLSLALRFGGPAEFQSLGRVSINELKMAQVERGEFRRALAAEHVLKGDAEAARELNALPRDLFTLTVEGEHWLRLENVDNAIQTWTEAVAQQRTAWTLFGLARAYLAGNRLDEAGAAAKQVLEQNPQHVGAKLLQVDVAIRAGDLDERHRTALDEVRQAANVSSPAELVLASTLSGEFDFATGRTSRALEAFEQALEVTPGDTRALVSSGRALFGAGRHAAALARYQTAATGSPSAIAPKLGIVRTQLALDQLDQASAQIQALRGQLPGDVEVVYLQGIAQLAAGESEAGRKALEEALELSKQPAPARLSPRAFQQVVVEVYVALASSFSKGGDPEHATQLLAQAAADFPASAALRVALGDVAFAQGQYEKALAEYGEARKLASADVEALFKVGQTLSRLRRFEEATAILDEVAKTDANYPGLPLERGLVLDRSGKSSEALAQYEQALTHDPEDLDIQQRVGCGRVEAGQGEAAAAILKDVLAKRPRSPEANYCLGRAMFALGNNVEALRLMRLAVEYDAANPVYRLHLGWVASDMGQVAVARRELNRALELDQGSVDAYWQRGVLNLKQGAARDAALDFKKALELNPSHIAASADMAQALTQLGKEGDALAYWEKAIAGDGNNATWLFRYGKVLIGRNQAAKGTPLLLRALKLVEAQNPPPNWLWQAHYLAALGLGNNPDAVQHWTRYLELSPHDSPYRGEAKRALAKAGQPWQGQ